MGVGIFHITDTVKSSENALFRKERSNRNCGISSAIAFFILSFHTVFFYLFTFYVYSFIYFKAVFPGL